MRRKIRTRTLIILAVTLFGLYTVFMPNPKTRWPGVKDFTSWSQIKQNLAENIRLGLDLRGGSHLVMQVQTDDVIKSITDKNIDAARAKLQEKNLPFTDIKKTGQGQIAVSVEDTSRNGDIIREFEDNFGTLWEPREVGNDIIFTLSEIEQKDLRERATEQALQIIDNRLNAFGVAESTTQRHGGEGTYQILIQMPGVDDPERVKNTLNAESNLELKMVAKGTQLPYATREEAEAAAKTLPGGAEQYEVLPYRDRSDTGQIQSGFGIVERIAVVGGIDMRDARAMSNQYGGSNYQINFSLTPSGAQRFGEATGKNIGERLAIVLNNEIKSAPTIQGQITDNGQITGSFTQRQAEDLALVLRSGALPARAVYLEERTVGPSLGADSIRQGVTASVVGLAAVVLFMLFYYRGSGINAVLALILNLLLLLAVMVLFDATLTLPGIAGVILTIGMGVDSNVLIFERIREELRNGKVVASAVEVGFDKAFLTIIDTHVTTIVSAV
ncbi:MAG TPA: protein translocase subunit SecD, partial [Blastocatellia bacterium]|nr:protein translocase subunit SecD [Blastocatellia bacterium]